MLSYKTIKHDGTVRYGFNIQNAVKNWASKINGAGYNGLDDIRRGLLLKTDSWIEGTTTYDVKTFGSFNITTTSYQPYLEVTYTSVNPTVTLNTRSITLFVGQTYQLVETTYPAGQAIAWHPYDPSIASVTSNGLVKGVSAGTSTIFAGLANNGNRNREITFTPQIFDIYNVRFSYE